MIIDLWTEGWGATGEGLHAAKFEGAYDVDTFDEAIALWRAEQEKKYPSNNYDELLRKGDDGKWRFWGIGFYDNEKDARAFLG
jgi:hypothetical protein